MTALVERVNALSAGWVALVGAILWQSALLAGAVAPGEAAEPPALVKARALYNAADYDGAITAATEARTMPEWADLSALVLVRAHLERYRQHAQAEDLAAAGD